MRCAVVSSSSVAAAARHSFRTGAGVGRKSLPARRFATGPVGPQAGPAPETVARIATGAAAQYALPPPSAAGPGPKPRRFFRSLVGYSLVLGTVFYTGSTVAALNNDRYQDFFVESVPGGEAILDQLSSRNLDRSLTFSTKDADVSSLTNRAIGLGRSAIGSVSEAVDRTFLQTQEKARQAEHRAREAAASFQDQASRTAREAADKVSAAGQRTKEAVNHGLHRGQDAANELGHQAQAQADATKSTFSSAGEKTKELAQNAVAKVQELSGTAANKVNQAANRAEQALPVQGQPIIALPERINQAKKEGKPTIVALPERANRADQDAAAFAKYRTVAAAEQARLQAEQEIARLNGQFEQLKHAEAQRAGRMLEEQEAKFRTELAKAQAELERATKKADAELERAKQKAEAELRNKDSQWNKELERERQRQEKEHARELEQSLEVKNDLISARLKEEVVSRGIELQKQWMSGVKAAVEKERGARLAQIEQLTEEAAVLDKLALENENILAESARVRTLTAAVRALSSAALGGVEGASSSGDDSLYAYRTPFRAQIDALRGTASKGPSADVYEAALSSLEAGGVNPDEGVESETTLQTWFKRRVAPKVLSVALLPDPTVAPPSSTSAEGVLAPQPRSPGLFAHLVSATLSPLLAKKTPSEALVLASQDGKDDDIPTVLARAEFWLEKGRLEDAVREVNRLKGWGKTLSADWLAEARKRLVVQQAVELIDAEAKVASLRAA